MSRFVKLDAKDQPLPASAKKWVGVHDQQLNLIWDASTLGKSDMTYAAAEKIVAKARGGRRLPTVEELFLLADRTKRRPAIDTTFFPDTHSDWYWTSTPFVGASGCSWVVAFLDGSAYYYGHGGYARVRAVRSAPAGAGQ